MCEGEPTASERDLQAEARERRKPFTAADYWWPILAFIATQLAALAPFADWQSGRVSPGALLAGAAASYPVLIGLVCWRVRRRKGTAGWLRLGDPRPGRWLLTAVALTVAALLVTALLTTLWAAILQRMVPPPLFRQLSSLSESVQGESVKFARLPGGAFVLALVVIAGLAPIAEEIFFRGLLFAGLAERWGAGQAAVFSALVFAALHFHPLAFPAMVAIGLALAWAYCRGQGLILPIAVHALNNAVGLTVLRFFPDAPF